MTFLQRLHLTINEHDLLRSDDTILVAFSGGPDSTALLHGLRALGYDVLAAHLHHGLRGEEADEDAQAVAELCKSLRIPLTLERWDVLELKQREHISTQEAARLARKQFLQTAAERVGATKIATAHNQDDRVESVLLNILRGTGTEGLRGIAYRNEATVRPILDISRKDVEAYCAENGLSPRIDHSNESSQYSRNNIRHELLPYLERRYNAETRAALLRLSQIAALESDFLSNQARFWLNGQQEIPIPALSYESLAFQRRIVREWLRAGRDEALTDISFELIESLLAKMKRPFTQTLPGAEILVRGDGSMLTFKRLQQGQEPDPIAMPILLGEDVRFFGWIVRIDECPAGVNAETLVVKTWENGDKIVLPIGTRKLQDVFTDAKVPRDDRRRYPIVADKDGIIAVPGLSTAARAKGIVLNARPVNALTEA